MSEIPRKLPDYRPCVGVMVLNRDGLVWAGQRVSKSPRDPEGPEQWWQMPQGGIDRDSDPVQAGLRELEEETGIRRVAVLAVSNVWRHYDFRPEYLRLQRGHVFLGQSQKWIAVRFLGNDEEVNIGAKGGLAAEFCAWQWLPIHELPSLVAPFKRHVYVEVVREFEHLGTRFWKDANE